MMREYPVKIIEVGETSITFSVDGGKAVRLERSRVLCMSEPRIGREIKMHIPDWLAVRYMGIVGEEIFRANRARMKRAKEERAKGNHRRFDKRYKSAKGSLPILDHVVQNYQPLEREKLTWMRGQWWERDESGRILGVAKAKTDETVAK